MTASDCGETIAIITSSLAKTTDDAIMITTAATGARPGDWAVWRA